MGTMHLYVDADARKAADAERELMPAHYFAAELPSRNRGRCAYRTRRGGTTCDKPFDHPSHLDPPTGP